MAEWSIHAVCCGIIVEDGRHHWPVTLLLLLQYYYQLYSNLFFHCVQWEAASPHQRNIQLLKKCHTSFSKHLAPAKSISVMVFKCECKCKGACIIFWEEHVVFFFPALFPVFPLQIFYLKGQL